MPNYHVELPGKLTLAKLSKAIEGEEALGTQFVNSLIWVNAKNEVTNLAEFRELDQAPQFGAPTLVKVLPGGSTPVWTGPMIVQGAAQNVFMLRAAAGA